MIYEIYTIYDSVAGQYGEPWTAPHKGVALRRFNYLMKNAEMVSSDCKLYKLATYNIETGEISPALEFVTAYVEVE